MWGKRGLLQSHRISGLNKQKYLDGKMLSGKNKKRLKMSTNLDLLLAVPTDSSLAFFTGGLLADLEAVLALARL